MVDTKNLPGLYRCSLFTPYISVRSQKRSFILIGFAQSNNVRPLWSYKMNKKRTKTHLKDHKCQKIADR